MSDTNFTSFNLRNVTPISDVFFGQGIEQHQPVPLSLNQGETALVLVAAHDKLTREILTRAIKADGYQVIEARTSEECIDICVRLQPNIVLLDTAMADMDGFSCCRRLQVLSNADVCPILMMTESDNHTSIDQALAAGATDFVLKPIHWASLRQRIRRLVKQARLYHQAQQFNSVTPMRLEESGKRQHKRAWQASKALDFEVTLRRITEKVRESLDESQILRTVVQELSRELNVGCCNISIYDHNQQTATMAYEYATSIRGYPQRVIDMKGRPDLYQPLLQGQTLQFCSLTPNCEGGTVAILACPIQNGHSTLGDIWLVNPSNWVPTESEIQLVKQVATQCAIALHQARLYQTAQEQVRHLERLNCLKDDFLNTISHELRSPTTNMRLVIQMLEKCLHERKSGDRETTPTFINNDKALTYLQILHHECEREINLINDLLDLHRLESGNHWLNQTEITVSEYIQSIVEPYRERAKTRYQSLQTSLPSNLPTLISHPGSLKRILAELLNNACKYTPPGGKITVTAQVNGQFTGTRGQIFPGKSRSEETNLAKVTSSSNQPSLQIRIANSGIEIPPQELPHIFDKFYRVPNGDPWKQGGTGLGLALVKELVKYLGGYIEVESTPKSTCFTVRFLL